MTEDRENYAALDGRGWVKDRGMEVNPRAEYRYRSWRDLKGLPTSGQMDSYSGGGYVLPLHIPEMAWNAPTVPTVWSTYIKDHLDVLHGEGWIDNRTRAVFVEFGVYNPGVNMFGVCWMMLETAGTGMFEPWYRFEPVTLYRYHTPFALVVIVTEVVYVIFILVFMVKEFRKMYGEGLRAYLQQFWTWIELGIIGLSLAAVGFHIARIWATTEIEEEFKESHGNSYVKLQLAAALDETFTYLLATVVFLANVKILKLLKFNRRLGMLGDTLGRSKKELVAFSVIFSIFFTAFCSAFYLLLSRKLPEFSDYIYVMEESFSVILGKFDFQAIIDASSIG